MKLTLRAGNTRHYLEDSNSLFEWATLDITIAAFMAEFLGFEDDLDGLLVDKRRLGMGIV